LKTFVGDGERLWAGKADNSQAAFAEGRGDRSDGVVRRHRRIVSRKGAKRQLNLFGLRREAKRHAALRVRSGRKAVSPLRSATAV
jgi:hypothetical protein